MDRVEEIERAIESLNEEEFARVAEHIHSIERNRLAELRSQVGEGFDAIERGEFEEYDEVSTKALAEDTKQRGRAQFSKNPRR